MSMKMADVLTAWLLIIAGVNAGMALFDVSLVDTFLKTQLLQHAVAGAMGAAAIYQFVQWRAIRRRIRD